MSKVEYYPLRKLNVKRVPSSFGNQVTSILSNGHVYEISGVGKKRRQQVGLMQVSRVEEAIKQVQKISQSNNAEELLLNKEKSLLTDISQIERVWTTLSEMCSEIAKKGLDVKDSASTLSIINTLINLYTYYCKANNCCTGEVGAQIKNDLRKLEDKLIVEVSNKLGTEYANEWSSKLSHAWKTKEV